jgi:glycosyltransferase involved in cell wall biosynthesis
MNRLHWPALSTNTAVSVVICCHNSAAVLPPTLTHLAAQAVDPSVRWEVVVIDNASTDDTVAVAMRYWPASAPAPLRVISEPRLGLRYARERGIAESSGDIVAFVDDDNWVCPVWVQTVHDVMRQHPAIGALGSVVEPEFDIAPPSWFSRVSHLYAVGPEGAPSGDVTTSHLICGAGLSVRRQALTDIRDKGFRPVGIGRQGSGFGAGEDIEMNYALRLSGWRLWVDPRLRVRHFLPARRLRWDYARKLAYGSAYATPERDALICACKPPRRGVTRLIRHLRERWFWQTGVAVGRVVPAWRGLMKRRAAAHHEGDPDVLHLELVLGRLKGLFAMQRGYDPRSREIRQIMERMEKQTRG